jgi:hypothetical protein
LRERRLPKSKLFLDTLRFLQRFAYPLVPIILALGSSDYQSKSRFILFAFVTIDTHVLIGIDCIRIILLRRLSSASSSLLSTLRKVQNFFFCQHPLSKGITRLEWTCKCGHRSYDNYSVDIQAVRTLAAKMLRSGTVTRAAMINMAASKLTNILNSVRNGIVALWRQIHAEKDQSRMAGACRSTVQTEPSAPPVGTGVALYLGLCFQGKAFTPWLSHLKIAWTNIPEVVVNSDQELFRQLRKKREQEEGKLGFKLSSIKFVKVS